MLFATHLSGPTVSFPKTNPLLAQNLFPDSILSWLRPASRQLYYSPHFLSSIGRYLVKQPSVLSPRGVFLASMSLPQEPCLECLPYFLEARSPHILEDHLQSPSFRLPRSPSHSALPFPLSTGLVLFGYNRCSQPSPDCLYIFTLVLSSCLRGMVSSIQN